MDDKKRTQLSKGLLDMRFMKRTKDSLEKQADDAIGTMMYSHEVTENMKKKGELIFIETSMMYCKDIIEGRVSFGGKNPAVERLMKQEYNKRMAEIEKTKEKDISDADMAKQSSLSSNIGKRVKTKNQKKFLKPDEI